VRGAGFDVGCSDQVSAPHLSHSAAESVSDHRAPNISPERVAVRMKNSRVIAAMAVALLSFAMKAGASARAIAA